MSERLTVLAAYARIRRLYLRWAPLLLRLGLVVFVPLGLVHAVTISAEAGGFELGGAIEVGGVALALLVLTATGLLGEVFYAGAVATMLTHDRDGDAPTLREIATEISYGRLIAVDVAYAVLVAVGFVLLVAPGIAAFVWLGLAAPVVEIEGRGLRAAFARSASLVRGRFWAVLAILLPIQLLDDGVTNTVAALVGDLLGETLLADWLTDVLANLAFTPFYAVAAVLLTVTLIREKDGTGPRLHSAPVHA